MQMVDPIARGNAADTANGCQMMSNSYVEKDLNRNEHCMIAYSFFYFKGLVLDEFLDERVRSLVVSDLRSETKGSLFESGCYLCAEMSSLQ